MNEQAKEQERDRRILAAAFLRDSEMQNKDRLSHIHQILHGEQYRPDIYRENISESPADAEEKLFWKSFRNRCIFAMLITIILYVGMLSDISEFSDGITKLQMTIEMDYSENLFDFINQIPYTLDYEKINA